MGPVGISRLARFRRDEPMPDIAITIMVDEKRQAALDRLAAQLKLQGRDDAAIFVLGHVLDACDGKLSGAQFCADLVAAAVTFHNVTMRQVAEAEAAKAAGRKAPVLTLVPGGDHGPVN